MQMTSASANKLMKKFNEDKEYWLAREKERQTYISATDEEPVIPEYDYAEVAGKIAEIDDKILRIKHAINRTNATNTLVIGTETMTIDMILVKMAQLNNRKSVLAVMRKRQPKARVHDVLSARKSAPEYEYINYDLETVNRDYERIDAEIMEMQLALDRYNQTVTFEVDI